MKEQTSKLAPEDFHAMIPEYEPHVVRFDFWRWQHGEDYEELKPSDKQAKILSVDEIAGQYNLNEDVAKKLYGYQLGYIHNFQASFEDLVRKTPRFLEVEPYKNNKKYESTILNEYVHFTGTPEQFNKSFHPSRNLLLSVIGRVISLIVYVAVIIFGVRISSWFDWFSVVAVAMISLIWLGATLSSATDLPGEYRARKLIWSLNKRD